MALKKKILKNRFVTNLIAMLLELYIFLLFKFCKIEVRFASEAKKFIEEKRVCMLCYWHGRILPFPKFVASYNKVAAVVSVHGDGEYLTRVLEYYGHHAIRGSSRKNNVQALMNIIKTIKHGVSVAITPDGPKGPRFKIKGAVGELAMRYKLPVIPFTYSASNARVLKTWDRFILPIPFKSRIVIEVGKPIMIADNDENPNGTIEKVMLKQTMKLDKEMNVSMDYQ